MRILAIESSCDETAAAIVEDGTRVESNVIASSSTSFTRTGGVIPEDAARKQLECILPVIHQAMSGVVASHEELDAIAVTRCPGLLGSLLVGVTAARTLSTLWKKPLIGVHHTLGHLSSTWLEQEEDIPFPLLALSVSGGHTELWLRTSHTDGTLLGSTRDDAAGEAFDKGATLLGLPYPGGPSIAEAAHGGDEQAYPFPLPLKGEPGLDFSFSGLKTHLRYTIQKEDVQTLPVSNLSASYQHALCAHLVDRVQKALVQYPDVTEVHLVGGVSANSLLRAMMQRVIGNRTLRYPAKLSYCTDNAAMIGAAAYFMWKEMGDDSCVPFETKASMKLQVQR